MFWGQECHELVIFWIGYTYMCRYSQYTIATHAKECHELVVLWIQYTYMCRHSQCTIATHAKEFLLPGALDSKIKISRTRYYVNIICIHVTTNSTQYNHTHERIPFFSVLWVNHDLVLSMIEYNIYMYIHIYKCLHLYMYIYIYIYVNHDTESVLIECNI